MMGRGFNRAWLATLVCCVSVVAIGLSVENPIYSLPVIAALCVGLLFYGSSRCSSSSKTARLLLFNSALFGLIVLLLGSGLDNIKWDFTGFTPAQWEWLHRAYRVWWLSQRAAIILALIVVSLLAVEAVGNFGGAMTRGRFQKNVIVAALILAVMNLVNFLRTVTCSDCFFRYGVPFAFFRKGGFAGGGGFIWSGLLADYALMLAAAALCTLVWNRIGGQPKTLPDPRGSGSGCQS